MATLVPTSVGVSARRASLRLAVSGIAVHPQPELVVVGQAILAHPSGACLVKHHPAVTAEGRASLERGGRFEVAQFADKALVADRHAAFKKPG